MEKKIRILHVVHDMGLGGYENYLMNIFRKLDKSKFEFNFLVFKGHVCYFEKEINELGGKVYHCTFADDKNYFKARKQLKKIVNENQFDILHCHSHYYSFLYLRYFRKRIPHVILHSHNSSREHTLKGFIVYCLSRLPSRKKYHNLACSQVAGEYFFGKKGNFKLCPNCIDTEKFLFDQAGRDEVKSKYKIDENTLVLGNIGRFIKQKNLGFLLEISKILASKNVNFKLCLCGNGVLKQKMIDDVSRDPILKDKVIFLETGRTEKYYSMFDLFLLPSLSEGFPLTLLESQASGCVSLASSSITKEVFLTDKLYYLDIHNPNVWAEKIISESRKLQFDRKSLNQKIKQSQYDSINACKFLESYYLEQVIGK